MKLDKKYFIWSKALLKNLNTRNCKRQKRNGR